MIMWPLKKAEPEKRRVLVPLRSCSCGQKCFAPLRAADSVHCVHCGAFFLIVGAVMDPVAKYEYVSEDKEG